jgi:hypothetical protein
MWVPTLAGIARMVPITAEDSPANVGATWSLDLYTVPTGRAALITHMLIVWTGGTAPTRLIADHRSSAGLRARLIRHTPAAISAEETMRGAVVWLAEGDLVRFRISGGDDTTDMLVSLNGVEFDWVDVT